MHLFKVWDLLRQKRHFFCINADKDIYESLILKVNEKFEIDGVKLVIERDGTQVDEDEILVLLKEETFMVLEKNEHWTASQNENNTSFSSLPTTVSLNCSESSTTVSVEKLEESLSDGKKPVSEYSWKKYPIPWHLVPEYMLKSCEQGNRNPQIINSIKNIIVDNIKEEIGHIPSKACKILASRICDKYPLMFIDKDEDGVVLGDGTHSLYCKMYERNNYFSRPHKRKSEGVHVQRKTVQKSINSRAGCSNWDPPNNNNDDGFAIQRKYINNLENPPDFKDTKEQFPDLFVTNNIYLHFKKLTSRDTNEVMQNMKEKCEKILAFGKQKGFEIVSTTNDGEVANTIEVISKYFKENIHDIFYHVENLENLNVPCLSPCILKCSQQIESEESANYFVVMENSIVVAEGHQTFDEALAVTFCLYFLFNLQYPKKFNISLETIQRYFFKIHPDCGSKSEKKSVTKKKVISFIKKFA